MIGRREGVPPESPPKALDVKGAKEVERPDCGRETVTELRFRAQMVHLGLSERTPVEDTLERIRTTKIQDL